MVGCKLPGRLALNAAAPWLLAAVGAGGVVSAQAQPLGAASAEPDAPLPITVTAEPQWVVVRVKGGNRGAPFVRVKGQTLPFDNRPVRFSVEGAAAPIVGSLPVDDVGAFAGRTFAPLEGGDHTITVTAPDGRGTASATVKVIEFEQVDDEVVATLKEVARVAEAATAAAQAKIDASPESPAKDRARRKVAAAKAAVAQFAASPDAAAGITGLIGALGGHAAFAERAARPVQSMAQSAADLRRETARVRDLTSQISSADVGCHQLAFVSELFKAVSALLNVSRNLITVAVGLSKDVVSDATANAAKAGGAGSGLAFAAAQVAKNGPELNRASALAGNAYGLLADAGAFIADTAFGAYCEQFVGPFAATMSARFTDPAPWWSYEFKLTGRLMLYYPKDAKGDSIRLHGRLEGFAYGFETKENALTVLYPTLMSSAIQVKKQFPPIDIGSGAALIGSQGAGGAVSAYVEGSAAARAVPNSFLIDVTGVLEKDSLSLLVGAAKWDFSASHRVVAVPLSPLALTQGLVPIWYELPFKDAHHVFLRVSKGQAMKLAVTRTGSVITADGRFAASSGSGGSKGDYSATLKACNPSCDGAAPDASTRRKM